MSGERKAGERSPGDKLFHKECKFVAGAMTLEQVDTIGPAAAPDDQDPPVADVVRVNVGRHRRAGVQRLEHAPPALGQRVVD